MACKRPMMTRISANRPNASNDSENTSTLGILVPLPDSSSCPTADAGRQAAPSPIQWPDSTPSRIRPTAGHTPPKAVDDTLRAGHATSMPTRAQGGSGLVFFCAIIILAQALHIGHRHLVRSSWRIDTSHENTFCFSRLTLPSRDRRCSADKSIVTCSKRTG